jgi:hypothetical protein
MSTQKIIYMIETSTIKPLQYKLTQLSDHLWTVTGSLPAIAIQSLHAADYLCYMAENEFFISSIAVQEQKN